MVEEKFVGKEGRRLSATIVALIILVSVVPVGFFMAVLPVSAEQTGESESGSGDGSYYVYGHVYDPDGMPVNSSLVIVTNMRTGDGNATWTDETGYYHFNLAEMNNSYQIGDEIKVTGLDGINIGNITINIGTGNPGVRADVTLNNNGFEDRPTPINHDFAIPEIPDIGNLTYPFNSTFEPLSPPNITLPDGLNLTEPEILGFENSTNPGEHNSTSTPNITLDSIRLPAGVMYEGMQRPMKITPK